jgi:acyl-coenzyme A thioesterase PaaI-like protein
METHDVFLEASRRKLRFASCRGELTMEQLWDVPLLNPTGFDLDTIARTIYAELRDLAEGSFVTTTPRSPRHEALTLALEVVKGVIAAKQADCAAAVAAQERTQRRQQLLDALSTKEAQALSLASREELLQQLAALDTA